MQLRAIPLLLGCFAIVACAHPALSAEIRLKRDCQPRGNVVVLGDVADIFAADAREAQSLAEAELVPAPAPGRKRFLRLRQIQDLLAAQGINLVKLRFSGASHVTVGQDRSTRAQLSAAGGSQVRQTAAEAIAGYLRTSVSESEPWDVHPELDEKQLQTLSAATGPIDVDGGQDPWVGRQQFDLTVNTRTGKVRLPVAAQVTLPASVVVTVRPLPRGAIIRASDVQVRRGEATDLRGKPIRGFGSLQEVVGLETTRAVAAGQTLGKDYLRRQLLVQRGDVVTVFARASGIQVRTTARAREEGSRGDLIMVESLTDRSRYFARVTGIQEVDVYARPTSAEDASRR